LVRLGVHDRVVFSDRLWSIHAEKPRWVGSLHLKHQRQLIVDILQEPPAPGLLRASPHCLPITSIIVQQQFKVRWPRVNVPKSIETGWVQRHHKALSLSKVLSIVDPATAQALRALLFFRIEAIAIALLAL
jgi:hypothetical protein